MMFVALVLPAAYADQAALFAVVMLVFCVSLTDCQSLPSTVIVVAIKLPLT